MLVDANTVPHAPRTVLSRGRDWLSGLFHRRVRSRVNHIALGTFCHAAAGLRQAGLRGWSGPFDWIFSTPRMVAACLEDDFAGLLDSGQLQSVRPEDLTNGAKKQCRHPVYEARFGLPIIFNHHDPARSGADLQQFRRSVARLRSALLGPGRNIFYLVSQVPWPEDEIAALSERLARYPSINVLVVATITAGTGDRDFRLEAKVGPGCPRYDLAIATRTCSLGAAFPDPEDDAHLANVLGEVASRLERTFNGHN